MTTARQQLGKHIPEITPSTIEEHPRAGIVKSEWTPIAGQRFTKNLSDTKDWLLRD
jgi:hypothetical protein